MSRSSVSFVSSRDGCCGEACVSPAALSKGKAGEAGLLEQQSAGGRQDGLCGKPSSLRWKV